MDADLRNIIEGHMPNTVDLRSYSPSSYPIEPLYDEMLKLTFKGLDLSHLDKQKENSKFCLKPVVMNNT